MYNHENNVPSRLSPPGGHIVFMIAYILRPLYILILHIYIYIHAYYVFIYIYVYIHASRTDEFIIPQNNPSLRVTLLGDSNKNS